MNMIATKFDLAAVKAKQNAAWSSGDYARIGTTLQITGEELAEAMNLRPGAKVLDVAAGNGNATLAFARRWCEVTSTDYVESLLDAGRARAAAENLPVQHQLADAEDLPFEDGTFDATVSTFGVMFTPNQERAAGELIRVTRSGGRIGLANWTADSFIGQIFKTLGRHIAPPAGVRSPALWGDRDWIEANFAQHTCVIRYQTKTFQFRYRSPMHFVEFFKTYYGPMHKAFASLDEARQAELQADILALIDMLNIADDGSMRVEGRYAQIVMEVA